MYKRFTECSPDVSVYWNIRREYRKGTVFGDQAWESEKHSLSSDHVRANVHRLLKNETLRAAFDPTLEVPGLRDGMRISTLNKLFSAKCDEEAANYLARIIATFLRIVQGSRHAIVKLAAEDVRALELRCPKFCTRDAEEIRSAIECGHIFRSFSEDERQAMKTEILSIDYVIPSLRTFFQDIYLLDACAAGIKHILKPGDKTIRTKLKHSFKSAEQQLQQSAAGRASAISCETAIQKLWIFALKNFQRMPRPSERTDRRLLARTLAEEAHPGTLCRLAKLAQHLGFQSPEIERLAQLPDSAEDGQDPDSDYETFGQNHLTRLQSAALSILVVKSSGEELRRRCCRLKSEAYLQRRCGRPRNDTYQRDRAFLTKEILHFDFNELAISGPEITSFFILRSQYFAFFATSSEPPWSIPPELSQHTTHSKESQSIKPPPLGESIMRSRRYSEESDVSILSLTTGEGDNAVSSESSADNSLVAATTSNGQESRMQSNIVYVTFKTFRQGGFYTFKRVNAGAPMTVQETARELMRDHKMKLFSAGLHPIGPEECFDAAMASGLNTIIALPEDDVEMSVDLRKAAGQLRRGE